MTDTPDDTRPRSHHDYSRLERFLLGALGTILSYGLSIATGAIISRKQGEGDMEGVRSVAWQSVLLLIAVSALTSAVGLFGAEALMVGLAGAKGEVDVAGVGWGVGDFGDLSRVSVDGNEFVIFAGGEELVTDAVDREAAGTGAWR